MKKKIVIIGAGHVGSHVARALAFQDWAGEIVLTDIDKDKAIAQAADVADCLSFAAMANPKGSGIFENSVRCGELSEYLDADLTVISVGMPRKPGQKRLDMLEESAVMLKGLTDDMKKTAGTAHIAQVYQGLIITITNPADIVADYVRRALDMPRERCFGTGTLLDTFRLYRALSESTGVKRSDIVAYVFGEHGDSSVAPKSLIQIEGDPAFDIDDVTQKTHEGGDIIIEGKGSTEFGIGQALCYLAESIVLDKGNILPLSVHLEGEYGVHGVNCGVPCKVSASGISEIIEFPLTEDELAMLHASAEVIRKHTEMALEIAP